MALILALLAAGVLLLIAGIHVYWAAGGRRGFEAALPEINGAPVFMPPPLATLFVAASLGASAMLVLGRVGLWGASLPRWIFLWGTWALAVVFLLRAVGDFKYVGFSKSVRGTKFARWDNALFSPLCLLMGAVLFLLARS